jgi:Flp pilus assembly protein TadB
VLTWDGIYLIRIKTEEEKEINKVIKRKEIDKREGKMKDSLKEKNNSSDVLITKLSLNWSVYSPLCICVNESVLWIGMSSGICVSFIPQVLSLFKLFYIFLLDESYFFNKN